MERGETDSGPVINGEVGYQTQTRRTKNNPPKGLICGVIFHQKEQHRTKRREQEKRE